MRSLCIGYGCGRPAPPQSVLDELDVVRSQRQRMEDHQAQVAAGPVLLHQSGIGVALEAPQDVRDLTCCITAMCSSVVPGTGGPRPHQPHGFLHCGAASGHLE
jgi:hypothetical protein